MLTESCGFLYFLISQLKPKSTDGELNNLGKQYFPSASKCSNSVYIFDIVKVERIQKYMFRELSQFYRQRGKLAY